MNHRGSCSTRSQSIRCGLFSHTSARSQGCRAMMASRLSRIVAFRCSSSVMRRCSTARFFLTRRSSSGSESCLESTPALANIRRLCSVSPGVAAQANLPDGKIARWLPVRSSPCSAQAGQRAMIFPSMCRTFSKRERSRLSNLVIMDGVFNVSGTVCLYVE